MALNKEIDWKGFKLTYWAIVGKAWAKNQNMTQVQVVGFKDETARKDNLNNAGSGLFYTFGGDLSLAECYSKIKSTPTILKSLFNEVVIQQMGGQNAQSGKNPLLDASDC